MLRMLETLPKYVPILIVVFSAICEVQGNGMLLNPPSRSSRWRLDSSAPINYDDNSLDCGGFEVLYGQNDGMCGLCGDPYNLPQPRPNELGGEYGQGVITSVYEDQKTANFSIKITSNRLGLFYFNLCNLDEFGEESEECFDKYPLQLIYGSYRQHIHKAETMVYSTVFFPEDLICNHCVLRWTFQADNNVGRCEDGTEVVGCGNPDTFRNCADIAITATQGSLEELAGKITEKPCEGVPTSLDMYK